MRMSCCCRIRGKATSPRNGRMMARRFSSSTRMADRSTAYRCPGHGLRSCYWRPLFQRISSTLSPDGRWIAFNSLESGRWEVYVASFPSFADKHQVSRGGGGQPLWRKDGKELFYLGLHGKLMAVPTTTGTTFDAGVPASLFQAPISVSPVIDQYAVTARRPAIHFSGS